MLSLMTWRRGLVLYGLKKSQNLNNYLYRLEQLSRQIDWQKHRNLGTYSSLCELFQLLRPVQVYEGELKRFGESMDGGYLVYERAAFGSHLLSIGVGDNTSFDLDISKIVKTITLCDFSVEDLPVPIPNSTLIRKKVVSRVQSSLKEISFSELLNCYPSNESLLVKVDIEGDEWEIFSEIDWSQHPNVIQLVVEFHGLLQKAKNGQLDLMLYVVKSLRQSFSVVNFHPNNYGQFEIFLNVPVPDVIEITFVKTALIDASKKSDTRHSLNAPNNPFMPEIQIPFVSF